MTATMMSISHITTELVNTPTENNLTVLIFITYIAYGLYYVRRSPLNP